MRFFLKYILILCLPVFCFTGSKAQRFPFFNLNIENGLAQSQAMAMAQDHYGNLWVGTLGGLSRYDGHKFTNYTVSDGLLSNTIYDIQFDGKGRLIINTSEGIQAFSGKQFTTLQNRNKNKQFTYASMAINSSNVIYYLFNGNLYTTTQQASLATPWTEGNSDITAIQCGNRTLKIARSHAALYIFPDNDPSRCIDSAKTMDPELVILRIFEDSRKKIWLLCNKGLYVKQQQAIVPFTHRRQPMITVPLLSVTEDSNGHLWLGTLSGVLRLKDTVVHYFSQRNGLSNNIIYALKTDKEGNVWLGSDGQGIFRYSGGPFISIDESFGLADKQVTAIAGNKNGAIYFGTYSGKLSEYIPGQPIKNINISAQVSTMISGMVMQGQQLWIGTRGQGLFCYENGRLRKIPETSLHPYGFSISALYLDSRNRLWVGMARDMLCIEHGAISFISLSGTTAAAFAETGKDSLIIAVNKGFLLWHNNQVSAWHKGTITDSFSAQSLSIRGQYLCAGSAENGILRYNMTDKTYTIINKKKGLSSDFVYNLVNDSSGNLWAGTGLGICRISFGAGNRYTISHYGKANGVLGLESNSNAIYTAGNGQIWFGTTEGASCYMPAATTTQTKPVSIILESVKLFGGKDIDSHYYRSTSGWYNIPEALALPFRFNNISFSFQAISLSPVDKTLYRYRLEGSEIPWSVWSSENTINISSLEPGKYTLRVECSTNGIEKSQAALSFGFTIKTPFHKSIWFIVCIFAAAILLGVYLQYTAQKARQKRLQREQSLRREEQHRIRERTAEDFHDEVGNKLTRINILTNVLQSKLNNAHPDATRIISQIQDNTQQLYAGTRDILWSLQPANDNLFEVTNHVRDLAAELFSDTGITFNLSGNLISYKEYPMPLDKSRNYIMIWKEALNNCLKYASPTHVVLQLQRTETGDIQVRLADDGIGFDWDTIKAGNGLKNMKARAGRMGAGFDIRSGPGGTQIIVTLPAI